MTHRVVHDRMFTPAVQIHLTHPNNFEQVRKEFMQCQKELM